MSPNDVVRRDLRLGPEYARSGGLYILSGPVCGAEPGGQAMSTCCRRGLALTAAKIGSLSPLGRARTNRSGSVRNRAVAH